MSNTTDRPDDKNLSASRATDDLSKDAAAIPAFTPAADRRSDNSGTFIKPAPIAPPARTSRRGFLMNTMVSAASLGTAAAVATPLPIVALANPDAELMGMIHQLHALRPRYRQIYGHFEAMENEWFKRRPYVDALAAMDVAEIPYRAIWKEIDVLESRICATEAKTLAGIKAKARWHFQFWCDGDIDKLDPAHSTFQSLFLELSEGEPSATASGGSFVAFIPDPIFAAIETHRNAFTKHSECVDSNNRLQEELPKEQRQSTVTAYGETIVETDSPQWIECERAVMDTSDEMDRAAYRLLEVSPTTPDGAGALLRYFVETDVDGVLFPDRADPNDDNPFGRSYESGLMAHVGAALTKIRT